MAASSHSSFPTCSPCSVWTSHMPPFRLCSESWELWVAMVEGANKKELMCLARSLGGLVPEECLHLLPPPPFSLHFHLFTYLHLEPLQRFRKIYSNE